MSVPLVMLSDVVAPVMTKLPDPLEGLSKLAFLALQRLLHAIPGARILLDRFRNIN